MIIRQEYLNYLSQWKNKEIIKVVSGVRRCGKSTLFELFKQKLLLSGVAPEQIISINFEDLEYEELHDYKNLYKHITTKLLPTQMNYIFLDEIQQVPHFEKAVDSLFLKENCDIYITGSNAYFMSGELATLLSGRYIELKMLPLSFKEFCQGNNYTFPATYEQFNQYLTTSAFPLVTKLNLSSDETKTYLRDIYNTVLLKDIVARLNISDLTSLENISKFMFHNIGNRLSISKIANTLKSNGKSIDPKTVSKYINGLTDSLLFYEAKRYNIKGKQHLSTNSKYYSVDLGLRNSLIQNKESDLGHILENLVYLELLRRGYEVYVGENEDKEIDFIAMKNSTIEYYQVSATTLEQSTLERELRPFLKLNDNYPKFLLTLDNILSDQNYNGIQKKNVIRWLEE